MQPPHFSKDKDLYRKKQFATNSSLDSKEPTQKKRFKNCQVQSSDMIHEVRQALNNSNGPREKGESTEQIRVNRINIAVNPAAEYNAI